MEDFSSTELVINDYDAKSRDLAEMQPALPFEKSDMSENKRLARLVRAEKSFFEFDKIYYPESMYSQGYFKSGSFHRKLIEIAKKPGINIILGSRDSGKTVTFKKYLAWILLTGQHKFVGTMSSTLPLSRNILGDVYLLMADNPRIMHNKRKNEK